METRIDAAIKAAAERRIEVRRSILLVVDDDPIQRRIIARIGAQAGHVVREAASLEEADAIFASEPIDCVTVDLSLGERDGAELLAVVARRGAGVPVLIISGKPERVLQATGRYARQLNLLVHGIFPKPLDLGGLRRSLAEICERHGGREEIQASAH